MVSSIVLKPGLLSAISRNTSLVALKAASSTSCGKARTARPDDQPLQRGRVAGVVARQHLGIRHLRRGPERGLERRGKASYLALLKATWTTEPPRHQPG